MPGQEAAARTLLGLMSLERGELDRAVRLLQAGRGALAPARHSWLLVRAGLGLALCLAELGNSRLARRVFDETLPFYGLLGDEREQVRLRWLEGRLTARLGRPDEGSSLLDRARRLLLVENSLADATLCFLDLTVVLAEESREAEVPFLLREMEEAIDSADGSLAEVRHAVSHFARALCGCSRRVRSDLGTRAGFTMRRLFRSRGHRVEALPFV
jgi:hypothetical protein